MKPYFPGSRNRKMPFVFVILGLVLLLVAIRAYSAENYLDKNFPAYSGNYAIENPKPIETLTVVSYNIWFGLNPEQALSEIKEFKSQKPLDILLLQEMDEVAAQQIARGLQMNYVYYPAAIEPTYHKNFGNAILSRWPILDPQKLILPQKFIQSHESYCHKGNHSDSGCRCSRLQHPYGIRIHIAGVPRRSV